jgi:2-dehydropantoate 2-reductase
VTLLGRAPLLEAIATHGLRVSDLDGADATLPAGSLGLAVDPAAAFAGADVVLVSVKSRDTAAMASAVATHAPPHAIVVSLQNGVGNAEVLAAALPGRVVAGMVPFNVMPTIDEGEPPRFHRAVSGTIRVAPGVPGLAAALDVPGARVAEHPDMTALSWSKLLLNLNNALNALSGLPLASELADRRWRLVLAAQLDEGLAAVRAAGIRLARVERVPPHVLPFLLRLPDRLFRVVAARMLAIDPTARSSTWEDLERGRPTEIDHLQGAVLDLAARVGVKAPLTARIARLVRDAERAGRGAPRWTPDQVAGLVETAAPAPQPDART